MIVFRTTATNVRLFLTVQIQYLSFKIVPQLLPLWVICRTLNTEALCYLWGLEPFGDLGAPEWCRRWREALTPSRLKWFRQPGVSERDYPTTLFSRGSRFFIVPPVPRLIVSQLWETSWGKPAFTGRVFQNHQTYFEHIRTKYSQHKEKMGMCHFKDRLSLSTEGE